VIQILAVGSHACMFRRIQIIMASFKFDFAPIEDGDGNDKQVDDYSLLPFTTTTSESIVSRMLNRCRTNAPSCQIINPASSCPTHPATLTTNHYIDLRSKSTSSTAAAAGLISLKSFYGLYHVIVPSSSSSSLPPNSNNIDGSTDHVDAIKEGETDLIPGVYEGGLKVWECSLDLCRYLLSIIEEISRYGNNYESTTTMMMNDDDDGTSCSDVIIKDAISRSIHSGGSTLEIGCGHGLPGCLILREICCCDSNINTNNDDDDDDDDDNRRSSIVMFSDFNNFVLQETTIPNAVLNVVNYLIHNNEAKKQLQKNSEVDQSLTFQADNSNETKMAQAAVRERSIFVAGDWMGLSQMLSSGARLLPIQHVDDDDDDDVNDNDDHSSSRSAVVSDRFDLILASETTYTIESCMDTAFLMLRHLKLDVGVGLVATKRFYFGVGGGTDAFISSCKALSNSSSLSSSTRMEDDEDSHLLAQLRLHVRVVQSYDTGNANIRDLLEVTCHKK
jgi:hypothetical protein